MVCCAAAQHLGLVGGRANLLQGLLVEPPADERAIGAPESLGQFLAPLLVVAVPAQTQVAANRLPVLVTVSLMAGQAAHFSIG